MSVTNQPSLTQQLRTTFVGIHANQQLKYVTCLNQEERKLLEVALKTIQGNGTVGLSPQELQLANRANFVKDVSAIVDQLVIYNHNYNYSGELPFFTNICNFFNWFIVSIRVELFGYITTQSLIDIFNKTVLKNKSTNIEIESLRKLSSKLKTEIDNLDHQLKEINKKLKNMKRPATRKKTFEIEELEKKKTEIQNERNEIQFKYYFLVNFYAIRS